jgi:DNA polymerase-1
MYKRNVQAILDIETNLAWDTVWCAGVYLPATSTEVMCRTLEELYTALSGVDEVIGHNLISFDLPVLERVWGFTWNRKATDTLVIGRLLDPSMLGGHSLWQWALRAGKELKDDFPTSAFDLGYTEAMAAYCMQDCRANWDVYKYQQELGTASSFSERSYDLEHRVRSLTNVQQDNGFMFDFSLGCRLHTEHNERMQEIKHELQEVFPPIVELRWSEKTGKPLKDKVTTFNPGSRQQVASRLEDKGAVWKTFTETGKPKVDETTLKELSHIPEALLVLEYLTLSKRIGMLKSWIDNVGDDDRIHGRVNTCGAVTGRMTHSKPNLAQIPSDSTYRQCFVVPEGSKLVGVDASGLELRMLAHYMNDDEYSNLILTGDIHTYNQTAAGLDTRDQAKTFIYAFLYGAGNEKIGSIVGGGERRGAKLKASFLKATPSLAKLIDKVQGRARHGTLPGLDGRRVHVRSEHAALNTLLQSAGAIVMKEALVIASDSCAKYGYPYKLVAQVHDEFQIEVPDDYADRVGIIFRNAIRKAGRSMDLRVPLDGDVKVGTSWADTH